MSFNGEKTPDVKDKRLFESDGDKKRKKSKRRNRPQHRFRVKSELNVSQPALSSLIGDDEISGNENAIKQRGRKYDWIRLQYEKQQKELKEELEKAVSFGSSLLHEARDVKEENKLLKENQSKLTQYLEKLKYSNENLEFQYGEAIKEFKELQMENDLLKETHEQTKKDYEALKHSKKKQKTQMKEKVKHLKEKNQFLGSKITNLKQQNSVLREEKKQGLSKEEKKKFTDVQIELETKVKAFQTEVRQLQENLNTVSTEKEKVEWKLTRENKKLREKKQVLEKEKVELVEKTEKLEIETKSNKLDPKTIEGFETVRNNVAVLREGLKYFVDTSRGDVLDLKQEFTKAVEEVQRKIKDYSNLQVLHKKIEKLEIEKSSLEEEKENIIVNHNIEVQEIKREKVEEFLKKRENLEPALREMIQPLPSVSDELDYDVKEIGNPEINEDEDEIDVPRKRTKKRIIEPKVTEDGEEEKELEMTEMDEIVLEEEKKKRKKRRKKRRKKN